jgi:hypothetical protein
MPRIDDYITSRKIAIEALSQEPFEPILNRSGFDTPAENTLQVNFLDRLYHISFPDLSFIDFHEKEKDVPIQEQILILHYMMADPIPKPTGKWIAYREIPDASFYFSAFVKRAIDPLKKVFGSNLSGLQKAAPKIRGTPVKDGDVGFLFNLFPKVPIKMIVWEGDEDFSAEANIIFDKSIGDILSPEDVAWLAGMVVYRLIALSHK